MTVTIITEGEEPKVEQVGYDDVPLRVVRQFADDGDPDAIAWLVEHHGLTAGFDPGQERDEHGKWTADDPNPGIDDDIEDLLGLPGPLHSGNAWVDPAGQEMVDRWNEASSNAKRHVAGRVSSEMGSSTVELAAATGWAELIGADDRYIMREPGGERRITTMWADDLTEEQRQQIVDTGGFEDGGTTFSGVVRLDSTEDAEPLIRELAVSGMVSGWAQSSNDEDPEALAMQRAAEDEFGIVSHADWDATSGTASEADDLYGRSGGVYRDFLRTQYNDTQSRLADAGIEDVKLWRGFTWFDAENSDFEPPGWAGVTGAKSFSARPLSSWSADPAIAESFADPNRNSTVISATIPADRILSFPQTGLGALAEAEFVVLGGERGVWVERTGRPSLAASAFVLMAANATRNEDWLRTIGWDLPTTVDGLVGLGRDPAKLLALPAAEAMPSELRAEIHRRYPATLTAGFDPDQPRDESGRWAGDGGGSIATPGGNVIALRGTLEGKGTPDGPRYVNGDIDAAVKAMAEGKSVRLDEEKQVSVLVGELGTYAMELRDRGEKAPDFDLCGVMVEDASIFCHDSLGVPRAEMPQLRGRAVDGSEAAELRKDPNDSSERVAVEAQFTAALVDSGVKFSDKRVPENQLRPTQNQLNGGQTGNLLQKMIAGTFVENPDIPVWTTKGGYIIDGHHRWAATVAKDLIDGKRGDELVTVRELDMEIGAALDYTRAWTREFGLAQETVSELRIAAAAARAIMKAMIDDDRDTLSGLLVSRFAAMPAREVAALARAGDPGAVLWVGYAQQLALAGDEAAMEWFGFNPDQQRGSDGKWIPAGGDSTTGEVDKSDNWLPGVGNVDDYLAANPQQPGEKVFEYQARVVGALEPDVRHAMLFQVRERYEPVGYIRDAAARWRSEHGLPEPQVDPITVPAPLAKGEIVAQKFEAAPDASADPEVRAAFDDFKRQNEEMYSFITRPEAEGGMGITVSFTDKVDPYDTAEAQADDLRDNRHIMMESGLGGDHSLLTVDEYDRFRAVHDVFGHASIGGGFDRHGEYQAWLVHRSMYTGIGADAMSSEYHGVNTSAWAGDKGSPGTGKSVLLPDTLIGNPWNEDGELVRAAVRAWFILSVVDTPAVGHLVDDKTEAGIVHLVAKLGLEPGFAGAFDHLPWHYDQRTFDVPMRGAQFAFNEDQERDASGRWVDAGGGGQGADPADKVGDAPPLPSRTDPEARGAALREANKRAIAEGRETEAIHDRVDGQKGRYTPEREAIHREIVRDRFEAAIARGALQDREAIVMAGLPGSGKTASTRDLLDPDKYVVVNADDMKEELAIRGLVDPPEGMGRMEAAPLMHEESSKLAKDLAGMASAQGYNILWDMTMSDPTAFDKRVDAMNRSGEKYKVSGILVSVPIEQSLEAAAGRYERGLERDPDLARYVSPDIITKQADPTGQFRSANEASFEQVKSKMDSWVVIDNTDFNTRIVDSSSPTAKDDLR